MKYEDHKTLKISKARNRGERGKGEARAAIISRSGFSSGGLHSIDDEGAAPERKSHFRRLYGIESLTLAIYILDPVVDSTTRLATDSHLSR